MRKLLVALFLVVVAAFFYLLSIYRGDQTTIISPIPRIFGIFASPIPVNDWFPEVSAGQEAQYSPSVLAKSAILVDYDTKEVIIAKNIDQKLPAASTIKIMTALVALENARLDQTFIVSVNAATVGENSMGLTAGEKLSLKELLFGLMLVSGNDAAVTIAEGIGGTEDEFVTLMNLKALELGLVDTKFTNSSGLDEPGKIQHTTVYDLVTIAHFVWQKYPVFGQITSTVHEYIEANDNHKDFDLYNDTNLLTTYPGVAGIKPGFTWEAGLCLVTIAENDRKKLLGVVLGSEDRRGEMKELLDFGFNSYGIKVDHPALDL